MLRAFWLFLGCAASMIAGLLSPVLANIAFVVTMAFFIAAWICLMIALFRFVQYGLARRGVSHRMSQDFGSAAELPRAARATW
jgi:membrane protein implicated in regulation of membrane protease activity